MSGYLFSLVKCIVCGLLWCSCVHGVVCCEKNKVCMCCHICDKAFLGGERKVEKIVVFDLDLDLRKDGKIAILNPESDLHLQHWAKHTRHPYFHDKMMFDDVFLLSKLDLKMW